MSLLKQYNYYMNICQDQYKIRKHWEIILNSNNIVFTIDSLHDFIFYINSIRYSIGIRCMSLKSNTISNCLYFLDKENDHWKRILYGVTMLDIINHFNFRFKEELIEKLLFELI